MMSSVDIKKDEMRRLQRGHFAIRRCIKLRSDVRATGTQVYGAGIAATLFRSQHDS